MNLVTYQDTNPYAENILPATTLTDIFGAGTITSGTGVASIATDGNAYYGTGTMTLQSDTFNTDDFVVNFGTRFSGTIPMAGLYEISLASFIDSPLIAIPMTLRVYKNATIYEELEFTLSAEDENYTINQWNRHYQTLQFNFGDTYDFEFIIRQNPDESNSPVVKLGAFSLVKVNKKNYFPSTFVKPMTKDTGWARYVDTAHTSVSPLVVNSGVTSTLTNNAATTIKTYLPTGVTDFYNGITNKFTPNAIGDYYIITTRFKAKNNNASGVFDFGIDIGGGMGLVFNQTLFFAKGANTEQIFSIVTPCYSLNTFLSNGGIPKVTGVTGNTSFYDIEFQIDRVHKAE